VHANEDGAALSLVERVLSIIRRESTVMSLEEDPVVSLVERVQLCP
jgi:hypothetical protein